MHRCKHTRLHSYNLVAVDIRCVLAQEVKDSTMAVSDIKAIANGKECATVHSVLASGLVSSQLKCVQNLLFYSSGTRTVHHYRY